GDGSGLTGVDNQTLSLSGTQLSITDGNSVNLAGLKDNLGNHTATQSLDMNGKWLTNDANFNNGIFLQTNGHVGIGTADPQAKLDIRPGNDGDPNSDPTSMTGLNVDISTFGGAGSKFAALFLGGNVGIGTSNPTQAKVVINGSVLNTLSYGWLNSSGQTGGSGSPSTNPYSLYTNERIAASEFNAHSDMRIKNIKGTSDAADDLNTLMQIEITDYTLRDTVANGSTPQKKVIAQQVAQVYPQAVTTNLTEVVPDIYQRAEVKDGWIM
ncbi:MAG: tail fiber domain-containing protein, partial [Calditrichaeota bacterium]|nr:tail fiber domain-containing protein [Calditrichota bacterium]